MTVSFYFHVTSTKLVKQYVTKPPQCTLCTKSLLQLQYMYYWNKFNALWAYVFIISAIDILVYNGFSGQHTVSTLDL